MHDKLFVGQQEWATVADPKELFVGYAETLGIEKSAFMAAVDAPDIAKAVSEDEATGRSLAVQGTPTFYLNGKKLTNPRSFDEFKKLIEDALAK